MATLIQIKRSTGTAAPGSLANGELAHSELSGKLFIGTTSGVKEVGGETYTALLDHTAGTLTASSALIVDANSKIDVLNVDNITINGNTISSTDTNGNITLTPNGTGDVDISSMVLGGGAVAVTSIIDDDTMATASATSLATSESIKAYVDSQVAGVNTLAELTDTDITTPADGAILIYDTLTSTWRDFVLSGDVTMDDSGVVTIAAGAVENTMLVNDSITVTAGDGLQTGGSVALGGSVTLDINVTDFAGAGLGVATGDLEVNVDNSTIEIVTDTLQVKDAGITNAKLANSSITVSDGTTSTDVALGGTLTIQGTANEIEVDEVSGTVTIGLPNDVTIGNDLTVTGNLTVGGTLTTVNTTNLQVEDSLIQLARLNNATDVVDIGIVGLYDTSGTQDLYAGLFRDASDNKWKLFTDSQEDLSATNTVNTSAAGYTVGTLVANLEGTATNVTGTVAVANGGTGLTALGSAGEVLQVNTGGTALVYGGIDGGSF